MCQVASGVWDGVVSIVPSQQEGCWFDSDSAICAGYPVVKDMRVNELAAGLEIWRELD